MRLLLPDGFKIPAHWHPKVEHVTVISGTFNVGMGDKFDQAATRAMPAGTFGFWPAEMRHFVWTKGDTIVQLHGTGPWMITYVRSVQMIPASRSRWTRAGSSPKGTPPHDRFIRLVHVYTSTDHIHVSRRLDRSNPACRIICSILATGCTNVRKKFFLRRRRPFSNLTPSHPLISTSRG